MPSFVSLTRTDLTRFKAILTLAANKEDVEVMRRALKALSIQEDDVFSLSQDHSLEDNCSSVWQLLYGELVYLRRNYTSHPMKDIFTQKSAEDTYFILAEAFDFFIKTYR